MQKARACIWWAVRRFVPTGGQRWWSSRRRTLPGTRKDRDGEAIDRNSSGCPGRYSAEARHLEEVAKTPCLRFRNRFAQWGDAIVSAAFIVHLGSRPSPGLNNEARFQHPLNGTVECARTQLEFSLGASGNFENDGVAMPVLVGERQKNMESRGLEREQSIDVIGHNCHTICIVAIFARNVLCAHTVGREDDSYYHGRDAKVAPGRNISAQPPQGRALRVCTGYARPDPN